MCGGIDFFMGKNECILFFIKIYSAYLGRMAFVNFLWSMVDTGVEDPSIIRKKERLVSEALADLVYAVDYSQNASDKDFRKKLVLLAEKNRSLLTGNFDSIIEKHRRVDDDATKVFQYCSTCEHRKAVRCFSPGKDECRSCVRSHSYPRRIKAEPVVQ